MEPMYYGCGSSNLASIRSKADAMKFAIETSRTFENCNPEIHLDKAKEIFQMFVENMTLPDVQGDTSDKVLNEVMKLVQQYIKASDKSEPAPATAAEKKSEAKIEQDDEL